MTRHQQLPPTNEVQYLQSQFQPNVCRALKRPICVPLPIHSQTRTQCLAAHFFNLMDGNAVQAGGLFRIFLVMNNWKFCV
jgi:hypothetical protein